MATTSNPRRPKAERRAPVKAMVALAVTFIAVMAYVAWATWDWPVTCPPPPVLMACTPEAPGGWLEVARIAGIATAMSLPGVSVVAHQMMRIRTSVISTRKESGHDDH